MARAPGKYSQADIEEDLEGDEAMVVDDSDEEELEEEELAADDKLGELYRAADQIAEDGGYILVYRRAASGRMLYLTRLTPDEFDLDTLKGQFGGGHFQVRFYTAARKPIMSRTVEIEGEPIYHRKREQRENRPAGGLAGQLLEDAPTVAAAIAELRAELATLRSHAPAHEAGGTSSISMGIELVTGLQKILEPILDRMADNRGGGRGEVETLVQGIELGRDLGGGGGAGPFDTVIHRILPLIDRLTQAGHDQAAQEIAGALRGVPGGLGAAAAALPPPPAAAGPGPGASAEPALYDLSKMPDPAPGWVPFLQMVLPELLDRAAAGRDPELRADVLLEEIPDGLLAPVHAELNRPAFLEEFYSIVPGAQPFRMWFDSFFRRVRDGTAGELYSDDGAEGAAAAAPGEIVAEGEPPPV